MLRLYLPAQKTRINDRTISTDRGGLALDNQAVWSVPNLGDDWLIPWTGWTCVVDDRWILQAYGYEHHKGGDVGHGVALLDAEGQTIAERPGHFLPGAIYQSPDSNPRLQYLHLVEHFNGSTGYNNDVNAGQPPFSVNTYNIPKFSLSNRWMVEVPADLKSHYKQGTISYMEGELEQKGGRVYVISRPVARGEHDLTFRAELPFR
jgi:hypothetical protein